MNAVKFRIVVDDLGVNLMPTTVPGLPAVILHAADELHLFNGGPAEVVRCGVKLVANAHLYAELAPLPSPLMVPPFDVLPVRIPHNFGGEIKATVRHLGDAGTIHIKPGDPVAMLVVHFAPTFILGEQPGDEIQPAYREDADGQTAPASAAPPPVPATSTAG